MNANDTDRKPIKEYADGWISERTGTDVPPFLKLAYVAIGLGCLLYMVVFRNGEIRHATRGILVQQFNLATTTADTLVYAIVALTAVFLVGLILFAFRRIREH